MMLSILGSEMFARKQRSSEELTYLYNINIYVLECAHICPNVLRIYQDFAQKNFKGKFLYILMAPIDSLEKVVLFAFLF